MSNNSLDLIMYDYNIAYTIKYIKFMYSRLRN